MEKKYIHCKPEVWGGMECTINRVGNKFRDQLTELGYYSRAGDLADITSLKIHKLRYPVLWEKHQPSSETNIDWTNTAAELDYLRSAGVEPIAGLLHHGSGPLFTDLMDPLFPEKFAAYAKLVATRFPWIQYYIPINEPLTTARFSGLYGHWYPHHTDERSFLSILVNQLKAIVLAMIEIRKINPSATLILTEDLCKVHSTGTLQYQANFENERRWLGYDLLAGMVNRTHYFYRHLTDHGISEHTLRFFLDQSCKPFVLGFNYYVTSERYLDDRIENYPAGTPGSNGRHQYLDTEAVRFGKAEGLQNLLKEAWSRYAEPLAITECHINCTREQQLYWLQQTWETACILCQEGIPVQAITVWALTGALDWNSLLTIHDNIYEAGAFECINGKLRPTALAEMTYQLATKGEAKNNLIAVRGWWEVSKKITGCRPNGFDSLIMTGATHLFFRSAIIRATAHRHLPAKIFPDQHAARNDLLEFVSIVRQTCPNYVIIAGGQDEEGGLVAGASELLDFCQAQRVRLLWILFHENSGRGLNVEVTRYNNVLWTCSHGDETGNPITTLPDEQDAYRDELVNRSLDLFIDGEKGMMALRLNSTFSINLLESC